MKLSKARHPMKQETAAKELNISTVTLSKYETGKQLPRLDTILKMSQLYKVPIEELVKGALDNVSC